MIYLALGTNLEPRRQHLKTALNHLQDCCQIVACSPTYESPALIPLHAKNDWQKNFLNLVIAIETDKSPEQILKETQSIESKMGRQRTQTWEPRIIDIDFLTYHNQTLASEHLTLPHPGLQDRSFFLRPLLDVAKGLRDTETVERYKNIYASCPNQLVEWMSIVNISPDSFSSSSFESRGTEIRENEIFEQIESDLKNGAHIIDLGAESTRHNAKTLSHQEEWERLKPFLLATKALCKDYGARLSVDTYHEATIEKSLELGVDIINDVRGIDSPKKQALFLASDIDWIAMHSVTIPADPNQILPKDKDASEYIKAWLENNFSGLDEKDKSRLIIDPGLGFGKDAAQSRQILKSWKDLKDEGFRILIGHSRKSFLNGITDLDFKDRDLETIGVSIRLAGEGVDILRIHNMIAHRRAYLAHLAVHG